MTGSTGVRFRAFGSRREAGTALAARLEHLRRRRPVILALPRGGVPVAAEVARALGAPLDVMVVRKLGVPSQPELGMGAIGEGGARVLNRELVRLARVRPDELAAVEERERAEVTRRAARYRQRRPMMPLDGRTVIVVDDGIATGSTVRAALQIARAHGARDVVLAVPVAPRDVAQELTALADEVVVLESPEPFYGVGQWYTDFSQTSDDEVTRLLETASPRTPLDEATSGGDGPHSSSASATPAGDVAVAVGSLRLPGELSVPEGAQGLVVFAHGSGSSRSSPRNVYVARRLQERRLATLLFDLLTPEEAVERANVFDVELLAVRLLAATRWAATQPPVCALPVGYFGASTGAAAALWAAADTSIVEAVVSRGGRPDLAGPRLGAVRAPTLLIVGGRDDEVLALNRQADEALRGEHRLVVVPGATHLFDEPGALEAVAQLAAEWFAAHLGT